MIFLKNMKYPKDAETMRKFFPRNIFCVIAGSTGSGKTNLMVNLLLQENKINYSDVYIYSPTLHQPEYIHLKNSYELMEKIVKNKTKTVCENSTFLRSSRLAVDRSR